MNQELLKERNSGIKTKPIIKSGVEFATERQTAEIDDYTTDVDDKMSTSITTKKPGFWKIFG